MHLKIRILKYQSLHLKHIRISPISQKKSIINVFNFSLCQNVSLIIFMYSPLFWHLYVYKHDIPILYAYYTMTIAILVSLVHGTTRLDSPFSSSTSHKTAQSWRRGQTHTKEYPYKERTRMKHLRHHLHARNTMAERCKPPESSPLIYERN